MLPLRVKSTHNRYAGWVALAFMTFLSPWGTAQNRVPDALTTALSPREHISIHAGWRFHRGDPDGASAKLLYDIRPEIKESADGKAADAEPEAAVQIDGSRASVIFPEVTRATSSSSSINLVR